MHKIKVLMLNTLPIRSFDLKKGVQKTAGNQTLFNTLKGYSDNNIDVLMITFCDTNKVDYPFDNVIIRRSVFYNIFKFIMNLKISIMKIIKSNKNDIEDPTTVIDRKGRSVISIIWGYLGFIEGIYFSIKFRPDVFYGYEIYSTIPSKRLSNLFKKPLVTRFQGTELGFFINDNKKFWNAKDFIEGTKVKSNLIIMANDGTDGDKVIEKLGLNIDNLRFWVNGLHDKQNYLNYLKDSDFKSKYNLSNNSIVICTANRFVDWKRIDRILLLMKKLETLLPNAILLAIGDGPEKKKLLKLSRELNLSNVRFLGVKEHHETIYHIANSDMYITLNHSGNLGNSILEALSLGVPIITIKNDSVEKVLKNEFNSILISENELDMLPNVIWNLFQDDYKLDNMKKNSILYATNNLLGWDKRMELEVSELKKLIKFSV